MEVSQKIKTYYVGEAAEAIIRQYEAHCANETRIMNGLQNDLFYQLYFLPINLQYTPELSAVATKEVYLDGKNAIPFQLQLQLGRSYTITGKATVNVAGIEINLENGNANRQGAQLKAQYQLYPEDHTIFSITGEATYIEENEKETVLFELYHFNTEERKVTMRSALLGGGAPSKDNIIISQETVKPKKGFFNFFKIIDKMPDKHLVCQGATCKCQYGTVPDKLMVKTHQKHYINDKDGSEKLTASDKDIGQTFQKNTFGSCAKQNNKPCQAMVTEWKGFYKKITLTNGGKVLLEDSTATCPIGGGPGCITIINHGQTAELTSQNVEKADATVLRHIYPFGSLQEIEIDKQVSIK